MITREEITAALRRHDGNVAQAASDLRVARKTMYNLMRRYGLATARPKGGRPKRGYRGHKRAYGAVALTAAVLFTGIALARRRA